MHFVIDVLPSGEAEFPGHAEHADAALTPVSYDHVLAPQFVHDPVSPVEYFPSAHFSQTRDSVAPT